MPLVGSISFVSNVLLPLEPYIILLVVLQSSSVFVIIIGVLLCIDFTKSFDSI